ncbi:MAG: ferredoxin reductase family protein [Actinomycetota bacterium]
MSSASQTIVRHQPRTYGLRERHLVWALSANAVLIVGLWLKHGALSHLGGPGSLATAIGQVTALLGTYAILIDVLLMSRSAFMERLLGMDKLAHWHRLLGFASTILICAHVVFTTVGYARGAHVSIFSESATFYTKYPDVLMAGVGTIALLAVVFTSIRIARRRLKYETWHLVHFYAYLAVILSFAHQLAVGSDFSNDALARAYWIVLSGFVLLCVLIFRFAHPLALTLRHRLRVAKVVPEAPGVVSVYLTGKHLDRLHVRAGHYFKWRFLSGTGGWPALPFSLSAAPNGRFLRFTARIVGDGTKRLARLRPGTWVAIEGPYGTFTTQRRTMSKALLIAAGIGIAPIRALLEELPSGTILLYRARDERDVIFREEFDQIAAARGDVVHYLVGPRNVFEVDPLTPLAVGNLVDDVSERDVYVCGPPAMMSDMHDTLNILGVPDEQVHYERFTFL